MSDNIVKINSTKETTFEFEVTIQGVSPDSPEDMAQVRFVISGEKNPWNLSFPCERIEGTSNQWLVKFPVLDMLKKENAYQYRIEVIVDGYYFEPASGVVTFLTNPEVSIKQAVKPKVSAILATKEPEKKDDGDEPKTSEEDEERILPAPEKAPPPDKMQSIIPGPETHPPAVHAVNPRSPEQEEQDEKEERDNATKIATIDFIQKNTDPNKETPTIEFGAGKDESVEESAKRIIFETTDEKPNKGGFLFPRDADGKKKVKGILGEKDKQRLTENASKIKDVIKKASKNGK